jgi:2-dehydropantoate 2-reductase
MAEMLAESHKDHIDKCVSSIMDEVITVAHKNGIDRDRLEREKTSIMARQKGSEFKPSMLVDLEAGRPIEVEAIIGEVVRLAASTGVSVPR